MSKHWPGILAETSLLDLGPLKRPVGSRYCWGERSWPYLEQLERGNFPTSPRPVTVSRCAAVISPRAMAVATARGGV